MFHMNYPVIVGNYLLVISHWQQIMKNIPKERLNLLIRAQKPKNPKVFILFKILKTISDSGHNMFFICDFDQIFKLYSEMLSH